MSMVKFFIHLLKWSSFWITKTPYMAGISDHISNFTFGTKKPYHLRVRLRFQPYGVFTLRKPYKSGFSCIRSNAAYEAVNCLSFLYLSLSLSFFSFFTFLNFFAFPFSFSPFFPLTQFATPVCLPPEAVAYLPTSLRGFAGSVSPWAPIFFS